MEGYEEMKMNRSYIEMMTSYVSLISACKAADEFAKFIEENKRGIPDDFGDDSFETQLAYTAVLARDFLEKYEAVHSES